MVQAHAPQDAQMNEGNNAEVSDAFTVTANLVNSIDKRLRAAVSADELKKLTIESAKPEFRKVIQ